jgi:hypothetical protein
VTGDSAELDEAIREVEMTQSGRAR